MSARAKQDAATQPPHTPAPGEVVSGARTPRNLLVTGGAGFIGSALIRWLLGPAGFDGTVVCFDALTYAGNLQNLEPVAHDPRYAFIRGDLRDPGAIDAACDAHAIDTVIHLAAESHVDRSIHGPADFLTTNVVGTFHLLEAIRARPSIHLHHVSTDEVFGSLGATGVFTEESPYDPRSPYSATKAASDHLVRAYAHTYGLSVTLSNTCNNYGPYQFPEKLVPLMIVRALAGAPLPVYGDGLQVRDWIHVDDHVEAIWRVVTHGARGASYNIGARCERTNLALLAELLASVSAVTGRDLAALRGLLTHVADRPGHDRRYAIDPTRIERELGWRARHTLGQGLTETVRWYAQHGAWVADVTSGAYRSWIDTNYATRP